MREIKFRAWDKARKEFLSAGRVLISIEAGSRPETNPQYLDILSSPDCYKDRFVIQQYTGINDKNGVEIYEGDIIFLVAGVSCLTVFDEEKAAFCTEYYDEKGDKKHSSHMFGAHMTEVGGNIYKNPELWPH